MEHTNNSASTHKFANAVLVQSYQIRDFIINIYDVNETTYYVTTPIFDFEKRPLLYTQLTSIIHANKERLGKRIYKFDELMDVVKSLCLWKIMEFKDLQADAELISELFFFKLIKLHKLMPLFLDEMVDEIYLDSKYAFVYIDHQEYGRCLTDISLTREEIDALLTRLKLEHPISVSSANPSLKTEFKTRFFHLRISMDFPPLSPYGPSFNIRKLKHTPYTIYDLIRFGSIHPIAAAYLIMAIKARKNITIIGEPNSGKTTLANAIDLFTPSYWRKIAIEDAIESINKTDYGYNQLLLQVDSFESDRKLYTKSKEILKLLHRSPDWIFLGEIQSKEHTQAMFEALTAGLKGIQTAHADSIQNLIRRWKNRHIISETDLPSLEIVVVMKKDLQKQKIFRYVSEIYEVTSDKFSEDLSFLTKIYDNTWNENDMLKVIQNKSFLRYQFGMLLSLKNQLSENQSITFDNIHSLMKGVYK